MISNERIKELLGDPNISDLELVKIRDLLYMLAELILENKRVKNKNEDKQTQQVL